jgi:transposase-like protein
MERMSSPELSCPRCRAWMRRVRSVPPVASHPELVTFRCGACDHVETIEHNPPRPSL